MSTSPRPRFSPWILAAAVLLCLPALLNGFPFLFADSGDYLVFTPRLYRSPFYGLMIFPFHLQTSLWPVIAFQALVIAHLVFLVVRVVCGYFRPGVYVSTMVVLTATTGLPWVAGTILADAFTPVMMLAIFLLGLHFRSLCTLERIYLVLLLMGAVAAHVAHGTAALGLLLLVAAILVARRCPWRELCLRSACLALPLAASGAAALAFNTAIHGVPSITPAGQTFFLANLIHHGPARIHLLNACPQAGWQLCRYAYDLPRTANKFLWGGGPLEALGGFRGMREEAGAIVRATLAARPLDVLRVSLVNFGRQLVTQAPARDLFSHLHMPSLTALVETLFGPAARRAYEGSLQSRDQLPLELLARINAVVMLCALMLAGAILVLAVREGLEDVPVLAAYLGCCIIGNAFLMGVFSGVYDRYQSRVSWFLVLFAIVAGAAVHERLLRRRAAVAAALQAGAERPSTGLRPPGDVPKTKRLESVKFTPSPARDPAATPSTGALATIGEDAISSA